MKLYHLQADGESFWVEAESFTAAIAAWRAYVHYQANEEPDSVQLVHDEPVIRQES
jgi:hypothetical protein